MSSCERCHKGSHAVLFCSRSDCPNTAVAAANSKVRNSQPGIVRYNELLDHCRDEVHYIQELADTAYKLANSSDFGRNKQLTAVGEAAIKFVQVVMLASKI